MKTDSISIKKYVFAALVGVFALLAFGQPAAAKTYYRYEYQPVMYQYQYGHQYVSNYQDQAQKARDLLAELQRLQQRLLELQNQYRNLYGHAYGSGYGYYNYGSRGDYDVEVDTLRARNIEDDEATLYGDIDLDDAPYAYVWFEYGEDSDLDEESDEKRVTRDGDFHIDIDDLDEDERYYFRAVAKDPRGYLSYGRILSFEADDHRSGSRRDDDEPYVETYEADDVEDDRAELGGEVDMNDFRDGDVFFVWGEDEDQVEDVEDEDRYADIDEDGDDLQKYRVYTNLDDDREFYLDVYDLDDNTDYYFRICVEYEDEDDDETLACGDVEHFETD